MTTIRLRLLSQRKNVSSDYSVLKARPSKKHWTKYDKHVILVQSDRSVSMTVRFHLFPFRTQKLSSLVPKIVSWKRLVKIGSRRLLYGPLVKRLRQRPLTPLTSVRFRYGSPYAPLAQLVEQLTLNQWAQGSSPWRCTTTTKSELFSDRRRVRIFCILWKTERIPCFHRKTS